MKINLPFLHKRPRLPYLPLFDWVALVLSTVLFTLAVIPNLVTASAYFDEGYSAFLAKFDVFTMAGYTALDVHPPLYYAVLHFWQGMVGDGVAQLRLLSVFFGWVAILFGFLLVRKWFNHRAAWLVALLMALSPLFIRYGSAMRMYTMALAIAFAGTYVLLHAVSRKNKWLWVLYAILVAAGMWTNYFMALVWITHLTWLLYEHRRDKDIMRKWWRAFIGAIILYLPWLPWLLFRYGEIQKDGFWIKPISVDTITSTITQSTVFRDDADTTSWLAVGVVVLVIGLILTAPLAYKRLSDQQKPVFRMILAMATLPVLLLAIGSLPPLRPSYVFRYVLVAAVASSLLMAVIVSYATFRRHNNVLKFLLYVITIGILTTGAVHAVELGNRNLDTDSQNKLGQAMDAVFESKHPAPIVVRSPYSYYAASLYKHSGYDTHFIFSQSLAKVGSTKPLYDHHEAGINNFDSLNKVWLVGEDTRSVVAPASGSWKLKDWVVEYDDVNHKVAAAAAYYERIK
jgi:uncharacterized membrane protein